MAVERILLAAVPKSAQRRAKVTLGQGPCSMSKLSLARTTSSCPPEPPYNPDLQLEEPTLPKASRSLDGFSCLLHRRLAPLQVALFCLPTRLSNHSSCPFKSTAEKMADLHSAAA